MRPPPGSLALAVLPVGSTSATESTAAETSDVTLLVAYILGALLFSFLCSIAEAVLLSMSPSYIESQREKHPGRAALLKRLRQDNVDRSLAAILTLNTIAHTVGAIAAGAQATVVFGSAWIGAFSVAMTLAILFLSEIVPKTIGAVYWTHLATPTAFFVRGLIFVLYPLVFLSEAMTRLIARGRAVHVFSRDEFLAMADIGKQSGHLDERESRIIKNLFRFSSLTAEDVMTPRTVMVGFPQDLTAEQVLEKRSARLFSRLPIYGKGLDEITGFVLKDDVLALVAQDRGHERLVSIRREIGVVPASLPLSRLLETFLDQRQHIVYVIDEYGGTAGIATLEDVVETLLGLEIMDEKDTVQNMRAMARQQWRKRAKALELEREEFAERADPSRSE
jgi:CBS domain containing-hemolysin-like protein